MTMNTKPILRICTYTALCAALLGASIAHRVSAQTAALNAPKARITDAAISVDQKTYQAVQQRIKALNDRGIQVSDYFLSKAQCWLDVSFHEYTRNDRSAFPQAALSESEKIVRALETNTTPNPGEQTPLVNNAAKLRDDLWMRLNALKRHAGSACAAQKTACAEVELVHAGNEYKQQGWRHANPYIQIAEDWTSAAQAAAEACPPPPAPAPAPKPALPAKRVLGADALFAFDRADLSTSPSERREKLDQLAQDVQQVDTVKQLTITGYTDRLGSAAYNLRLSERRAQAVKHYLAARGVRALMAARGFGKQNPLVECAQKNRAELIACLQPNRRVEIEIVQDD
ncbi:OmpA family protein [Candidatus Glomeribacter gigasporarum]|nr:OmpA family protein [Candidatus Glomeribacter gigasporarum]